MVIALMVLAAPPPAHAGLADYTVTETRLAAFPTSREDVSRIVETQVSPDGRHIATLETSAVKGLQNLPGNILATNGMIVRRDGEPGGIWPEIRRGTLSWSGDGAHLMFVARRDSLWHVVVDGTPGPGFTKIPRAGLAGPKGNVIYNAERGDTSVVMFKGRELEACAGAAFWWIDSSGEHIACVIPDGDRWQIAVDDAPAAVWDYVPYFGFTEPAGAHYYYVARDSGRQHLMFDTRAAATYDEVGSAICEDDGSCVAWVRSDDRWHVLRDGALGPGFASKEIWNKELFVGPGGRHVAYVTGIVHGRTADWTLHLDGAEHGPFDGFAMPRYSEDGARWGMVVGRGTRRWVLVDGEKGPEFEDVFAQGPFFSPGGAHVAYFVKQGTAAALMLDGREAVRMDKIIGPGLSFSADGRHWALAGRRGDAWHLVLDGEQGETAYTDVRDPGPVFADDGSISFIARKGDDIVRATYTPK